MPVLDSPRKTVLDGKIKWSIAMIQNLQDFKIGIGFSAFCLFVLFFLIPWQVGALTAPDAMMPVMITCFLLVLSFVMIIKSISKPGMITLGKTNENGMASGTLWIVVATMAAYAWLLELAGFMLTSLCAMVVLFMVFGVRDFKRIVLITAITLCALYLCFEKLLYAPLPVGTFFESILG
jgi:hypothetical protein